MDVRKGVHLNFFVKKEVTALMTLRVVKIFQTTRHDTTNKTQQSTAKYSSVAQQSRALCRTAPHCNTPHLTCTSRAHSTARHGTARHGTAQGQRPGSSSKSALESEALLIWPPCMQKLLVISTKVYFDFSNHTNL